MTSYTLQNVHELEQALASGARRVRFSQAGGGTREVEYRTTAEMRDQLNTMKQALGLIRNGGFRVSYPRTSKGIL